MGKKGFREEAEERWRDIAPRIIMQAKLEANKSVTQALDIIVDFEGMYDHMLKRVMPIIYSSVVYR